MNSLVYFDLEATGLKSAGRPRITEISLVAINGRDILDCHERIKDKIQNPNIKVKMCPIETFHSDETRIGQLQRKSTS